MSQKKTKPVAVVVNDDPTQLNILAGLVRKAGLEPLPFAGVEEAPALQACIATIFLTIPEDEMYNEVLKVLLDVMRSPFGVFGYLDEAGALIVPTMTRQIWDKCQVPDKNFVFPRATWGDSSWPRAIREKKTNYSNEVSTKTPVGHVPVTRHISVPILFQDEVIGLFQVANKETDYTEADVRTLEAIAPQVAPLLSARLQRERAERELRKLNVELEQRVRDRTAQLEAANQELEAQKAELTTQSSELKRAVEALVASNQQLNAISQQLRATLLYTRSLIEASLDPLVTINADGKITDVNKATETLTGAPRDRLIGSDFPDYFTEPNKAKAGYQEVFSMGFVMDYPLAIRHASGKVTDVLYNATLYRNEAGQVEGVFAAARDITERKKAEDALLESVRYSRNLIETSLDPLVTISKLGKITDVNTATEQATGFSRDQMIGSDFSDYFTDPEKAREGYNAVFQHGIVKGYPLSIKHRDGRITDVLYNASVYQNRNGSTEGVFAAARDITEQKRFQALIDAKNKELEQIVYVASHDLRSPLVNVDGFSRELDYPLKEITAMLDSGRDKEELEKTLRAELPDMEKSIGRIRASTRQMDDLLKGLLKLSRSGRAALQIADIDMNELFRQLASSIAFKLREAGIELTVDSLPACRGDAVQVTQVFSNLLDNAVKYLAPDRPGRIQIRGAIETGRAVYRVEDNGIGIAENHLDHVFEIFHRLDPGKTAGEGLGLTIARQALGRMHGEIRAESKPGQGSAFIVILPPVPKRNSV